MTLEVTGERWRESVKQRKPLQWTLLRGHHAAVPIMKPWSLNSKATLATHDSATCDSCLPAPSQEGSADRTRGPEEREGTSYCVFAARWHQLASCSDGHPPNRLWLYQAGLPIINNSHRRSPTTCRTSLIKCSLDPSTRMCPSSGTSKFLSTSCSAGTIS